MSSVKSWKRDLSFKSAVRIRALGEFWDHYEIGGTASLSVNDRVQRLWESTPASEVESWVMFGLVDWYCVLRQYLKDEGASREVEFFLAQEVDEMLAEECLINHTISAPVVYSNEVSRSTALVPYTGGAGMGGGLGVAAVRTETDTYALNTEKVEVRQHRRIHRKMKNAYAMSVLEEVRVKFGVPNNTEANRLSVRRFAAGIMQKHGVRPTQISKQLPFILELAFVPSDADIHAAEWGRSRAAADRKSAYGGVGPAKQW